MSKRPHHPWLENTDPDLGVRLSDADPAQQGVYEMLNGDMIHVPPAGSIPHQLSTARTEGTAATHDQQKWGAYGSRNRKPMNDALVGGATSDEAYRDEKSDAIDLYGPE